MKVLVIPDVHLKPYMFQRATELMEQNIADKAVCLMDIPDDWDQQDNVKLYEETYDAAIAFAKKYPNSAWCYGNHDLSYVWRQPETGFSASAMPTVVSKLRELAYALPEGNLIQYVHRIDNVLFSHGGLGAYFVEEYVPEKFHEDIDKTLIYINNLGRDDIWRDPSPIWLRPQYGSHRMYKAEELLQVVGHTPMDCITRKGNVISCDVFSTYKDGSPIGTGEFLLIDTETWEYSGVK